MAGWLLLTWDGAGNQGPMTGLARHLEARGRTVTVAGYRWQRHRFGKAGFAFRPLPRAGAGYPAAPPPEGRLPATSPPWPGARPSWALGWRWTVRAPARRRSRRPSAR